MLARSRPMHPACFGETALMHVLAHKSGHTFTQIGTQTLLLFAGLGLAIAAYRARDARLLGHPRIASRALGLLAAAALILAVVIPPMLGIKIAKVRPTTNAKIIIVYPRAQQVLRGNPATVHIRVRVAGARVVTQTSTHLTPDKGHIHLYLDGMLVGMAYTTSATVDAEPGSHRLKAEFVAVDHGPFNPPVTAWVIFRVTP